MNVSSSHDLKRKKEGYKSKKYMEDGANLNIKSIELSPKISANRTNINELNVPKKDCQIK